MNEMDLLSSFVLEFKEGLSSFDLNEYKNICASRYLKESIGPQITDAISPDIYCRYIDKAVENLDSISADVNDMDAFFSKVYESLSLKDKGITIPLMASSDIEKIRPEYLTGVSTEFDIILKRILQGSISESDIRKKYTSDEFFNKVKKQLVKTTVVINDVRDLMSMDQPSMVRVDDLYIQDNIIPFMRSYIQNVKELKVVAINTKGQISNSNSSMQSSINAIFEMRNNGKINDETFRLLQYYIYSMKRKYMNLCAYISTMVIRKISYYSYNMMSYMNLYNTIYNYFPDADIVLHESVLDGDLSEIDNTTLLHSMVNDHLNIVLPHIQNAIGKKKMEIANVMSKKYNIKFDYYQDVSSEKYPYDIYPYAAVNKTIVDITNNIRKFELGIKNSDLVVDDLIQDAGLEETFSTKYSDILANITNIEFYTSQAAMVNININGAAIMCLFNDISHYERNITIISNNINKAYNYIQSILDSFDANLNSVDDNTFNELNSFIGELMSNFKDYILQVTKRLLERLDNLTSVLDETEIPSNSEPEEFIPYDYSVEAYQEEYSDILLIEKAMYESMAREYNALRNYKERGVKIIYETQETVSGDGTTTTGDVTSSSTTENDKTSSTTTNTTNTDDKTKENLIQKFIEFIQSILNKFKEKAGRLFNKNTKWLTDKKQTLLNMDTTNTKITLARYEGVDSKRISEDISSAINKINTINATNIPSQLKGKTSDGELYLFGTIPTKIGDETSFSGRIKKFFTFGKSGDNSLVAYSGDDAKTKISEMVSFIEGYNNTYNKVVSDLDKLSKAASEKQQEIINKSGKATIESVMFEADENGTVSQNGTNVKGNKTSEEKINSSTIITSIVRSYSASILTVLEKKYLDYVQVLKKLAPDETNQSTNTSENEENK